jgi:DNA-cytosine methyltransferase
MEHLGDITKIDGGKIEPCEIVSFGSPCTDISIAGKGEGISAARSGLFFEAVRVMREMLEATENAYPRYFLFENVPNLVSIHGGEDWKTVMDEFAALGFICDPNILDAQEFGVAQRRKRIFIVGINRKFYDPADFADVPNARDKRMQKAVDLWGGETFHGITSRPHEITRQHLSEILEHDVDPKYYLTKAACLGILRRVDAKGKQIPPLLRSALENQAELFVGSENGDPMTFEPGATARLPKGKYWSGMCPALAKRVKLLASTKRLVYLPTNSFYQVLSAEAYSKHGFNIHGVVFDELHTQPNRKLFDVMTKGSGDARTQPLYFLITTAGSDTQSICYETHQKALDIIEGRKRDPTFYPVIYGAKEEDDWTDPKVWRKANPSLGITVGIDKVKAACESAKQNPAEENSFRQLRLNQWVKQAVRWMPMAKWDACAFAVDAEGLEGRVCYGGLDLSSSTDITAFVLVFPPTDEDDKYSVLPFFWIPEDNMDVRIKRDHVQYDLWEKQGHVRKRVHGDRHGLLCFPHPVARRRHQESSRGR